MVPSTTAGWKHQAERTTLTTVLVGDSASENPFVMHQPVLTWDIWGILFFHCFVLPQWPSLQTTFWLERVLMPHLGAPSRCRKEECVAQRELYRLVQKTAQISVMKMYLFVWTERKSNFLKQLHFKCCQEYRMGIIRGYLRLSPRNSDADFLFL